MRDVSSEGFCANNMPGSSNNPIKRKVRKRPPRVVRYSPPKYLRHSRLTEAGNQHLPCSCADHTAGTAHGHKSGVGSTAIYLAGERSGLPPSYLLKRRAALVPPKPKEFERA